MEIHLETIWDDTIICLNSLKNSTHIKVTLGIVELQNIMAWTADYKVEEWDNDASALGSELSWWNNNMGYDAFSKLL